MAEKFLDSSERLYGEPHPTRFCVRSARRIVVKVWVHSIRFFHLPRVRPVYKYKYGVME